VIATDVRVTVEPLAVGAYLLSWRCSGDERGGDLLAVDDQASPRWRAIADAHIPGSPALVPDLEAVAIAAHARFCAASTASSCS
jgi:hypothetical protein